MGCAQAPEFTPSLLVGCESLRGLLRRLNPLLLPPYPPHPHVHIFFGGANANDNDTVEFHYRSALDYGEVFDSTNSLPCRFPCAPHCWPTGAITRPLTEKFVVQPLLARQCQHRYLQTVSPLIERPPPLRCGAGSRGATGVGGGVAPRGDWPAFAGMGWWLRRNDDSGGTTRGAGMTGVGTGASCSCGRRSGRPRGRRAWA